MGDDANVVQDGEDHRLVAFLLENRDAELVYCITVEERPLE